MTEASKGHIGFSGGGTKIAGLLGVAEEIYAKYRPSIVSGVSSGAVIAALCVTSKIGTSKIRELILNMTPETFFRCPPQNKRGGLSWYAIKQLIKGKPNIGDQSRLYDLLMENISQKDWKSYVNSPFTPGCVVGMVDLVDGSRQYPNLKFYPREKAMKYVLASASIPVFSAPVTQFKSMLVDGGLRDHCPTARVLKMYPKIKKSISVYTRPETVKLTDFNGGNVINVMSRTIDIMNAEISKNDEYQEKEIAKERGINHKIIYLPSIMESVYDTDPTRLRALYERGRKEGMKI